MFWWHGPWLTSVYKLLCKCPSSPMSEPTPGLASERSGNWNKSLTLALRTLWKLMKKVILNSRVLHLTTLTSTCRSWTASWLASCLSRPKSSSHLVTRNLPRKQEVAWTSWSNLLPWRHSPWPTASITKKSKRSSKLRKRRKSSTRPSFNSRIRLRHGENSQEKPWIQTIRLKSKS